MAWKTPTLRSTWHSRHVDSVRLPNSWVINIFRTRINYACYRNGRQYGTSWNGLVLWAGSGLRFAIRGQHGRSRGCGCTTVCGGDVRGPGSTCSGKSMHLVNKLSVSSLKTRFIVSPALFPPRRFSYLSRSKLIRVVRESPRAISKRDRIRLPGSFRTLRETSEFIAIFEAWHLFHVAQFDE